MGNLQAFMNKFGAGTPSNDWSSAYELDPPSPKPAGLGSFIQRFTGMTESYKFYNGEVELQYNVDEHVYYLVEQLGNLTEQDGVTNTVHIINAAEMLVPWAAKMTVAKILRLIPTELVGDTLRIKPITLDEFTTIALEAKSAHKDKLDEAGDIGHMAHKCLEESILHAIANDPEKIVRDLINLPQDELARNAANSGKSWMDKHNVKWIETETKIYSRKHRYAGTMDGLAYVSSCGDKSCCQEQFTDRLSLIDWKSSNHLKIEYLFQTGAYQAAKMEEFPELKIIDRWILRLGKNEDEAGKFEPWHMGPDDFEKDFQGFLACLELTRIVESVNERMKSQKKMIRTIRKEIRETAKAIKKEQEKLEKALKKAEDKKRKQEEKEIAKVEAKKKREEAKAAKKAGVIAEVKSTEVPCTSTSSPKPISGQLDSTPPPTKPSVSEVTTAGNPSPTTNQPMTLPNGSTGSTEVTSKPVTYEEATNFKPIALPGEK